MDIETLNKIQYFLENSEFNSDEFILEALEHELERRKTNAVLNVVLDEFKRSANERVEYDFYDEKVCAVTVDNNGLVSVPPLISWNRERLNLINSYLDSTNKCNLFFHYRTLLKSSIEKQQHIDNNRLIFLIRYL